MTTGITRGTYGDRLTTDERHLLQSWSMWGSAMYPTIKVRSRWTNAAIRGIDFPGMYRTKREAVAAFQRFVDVLIEAAGQEAYERTTAAA